MSSVRLPLICGLLASLTLAPLAAHASESERPWRAAPFSVDAAVLARTFADSARVGDDDVTLLFQSYRLRLDEQGRRVIERHLIYQVHNEAGRQGWTEVNARWDRRRQDRPSIAARVISPDGRVTQFDPATLVERGAQDSNALGIYSDAVLLVGPLPDLRPGGIVEELIVTSESVPWFAAGTVTTLPVGRFVPLLDAVVIVEAPRDLPLRWKVRGARPLSSDEDRNHDQRHVTIDLGRVEPASYEALARLSWTEPLAEVVVATGKDWRTVARAYARAVDDTLESFVVPQELRPIVDANLPRREKVEALLTWIQARIRYTGVLLGESALLPWAPGKVVERGYGDCKDQSTLLVGLLRAAGIDADIALLRTGPAPSIEEDLPGIGSFDHAIVHVRGQDPLWVDPTVTGLVVGLIPSSAQGRRALVCSPSTSGLVEIPRHDASANLHREVRSLRFPGFTYADVVETTEAFGLAAVGYRDAYAGQSEKVIESFLSEYVGAEYDADSLVSWSIADAEDLSAPFALQIEVAGVNLAVATEAEVLLHIPYSLLANALPTSLLSHEELEEGRDPRYPDEVRWSEAYRRETIHRLLLPPGFVVREIPEPLDLIHGPIRMSIAYETDASTGEFVAHVVVDVGRHAMDLEDALGLAERAEQLRMDSSENIYFDHAGELLRKNGDLAAAIAFFRSEIADRPSDPIPRARLSSALLAIGLGEPARAAARSAVELDPDSEYAQRMLAVALASDTLGRELRGGMDRSGAIAAARRAIELEPEHPGMRYTLGRLLEIDDEGLRFGEGWDPDGAIDAFLGSFGPESAFDGAHRLLAIIGRENRWDEADSLVDAIEDEPAARLLRTATRAMLDGPLAAQREAHKGVDAERARTVLSDVGYALLRTRNYARAAEVFELIRSGSGSPRDYDTLLSTLRLARRIEESEIDFSGPAGVCRRMLLAFRRSEEDHTSEITSLLDPLIEETSADETSAGAAWSAGSQRILSNLTGGDQINAALREVGFEVLLEVGVDLLLSNAQWSVESDGWNGYRVRMVARSAQGPMTVEYHVIERDGEFLFLGGAPDFTGLRALECVAANRLEAAQKWIEWTGSPNRSRDPDPLGPWALHRALDIADMQDAADLRRVAIATLSWSAAPITTIEQAKAALAETADPRWRSILLQAQLEAQQRQADGDGGYELLRQLLALHPDSESTRRSLAAVCVVQGRYDEAESLLAEVWTDEAQQQRERARLAVARDDLGTAIDLLDELIESGRGDPRDRNDIAWYRMSRGEFDDTVLDNVLQSISDRAGGRGAALHTLACAYAERGQLDDAYWTLLEGLGDVGAADPDDAWSFVLARIAEHAGEADFARRIYESIAPAELPGLRPASMRVWADHRLQAMRGR